MKTLLVTLSFALAANLAPASVAERPLPFAEGRALNSATRPDGAEIVCDNGSDPSSESGWVWSLPLRQTEATPFTVSAESRAEVTPGGNPRDYSIYLDMTYDDGSHLYGQVATFRPKPDLGWQRRSVTVMPDKPVKFANCYLLYRNVPGRVRFRAPRFKTFSGDSFAMYDTWCQDLSALAVDRAAPRFLVRDAAAERGFRPISPNAAAVEGVRLAVAETPGPDGATFFDVTLTETTGRDRALSLIYALPIPGRDDFLWHDSPRKSETLTPRSGQRRVTTGQHVGEGMLAKWPFGAVTAGGRGLALGCDPTAPAVFRVNANPKTRELLIAFDLGFTREKPDAHFRFVRFAFPGDLGFRGGLRAYQSLFPDNNVVRLKRHGLWMAFHRISSVQGWEDFGFAVKEGDNEADWDDRHGLVTFHYTEPTSWWMTMKGGFGNYSLADCLAEANRRADRGDRAARAWRVSAYRDAYGEIVGSVRDTPWCVGAVWSLSSLPSLKGGEYDLKLRDDAWSRRYAPTFPNGVDGEYIDSAEPYMTPPLDFDRAHFAASRTPLSYDPSTKQPGIAKCLSVYEYVRTTADRCHALGRYLMGNGIPYSWPWLVPFSDFGGQETGWITKDGRWTPMSDDDLLYRRALSGGKPYCFLMNVNFDKFPPALVEKYMQRALAYGLFASFFSPNASGGHYFSRPELYNRDRPLFKKYVPICRTISEAGWRPVNTLARSETDGVFVEQFGDRYLTVFNPSTSPRTAKLRLLVPAAAAKELVTGDAWRFTDNQAEAQLPAETVRVLEVAR